METTYILFSNPIKNIEGIESNPDSLMRNCLKFSNITAPTYITSEYINTLYHHRLNINYHLNLVNNDQIRS